MFENNLLVQNNPFFVNRESIHRIENGSTRGFLRRFRDPNGFQIGSLLSEKIIIGSLKPEKIGSLESEKSGPYRSKPGS